MHFRQTTRSVRRPLRLLQALVLIAAGYLGLAQPSVSVQIMTDELNPADFGGVYSLGRLSNEFYTYGLNFIIQVSYSGLTSASLGLALTGSQDGYQLVWRVAGTSDNMLFGQSLGADVIGLTGSDSGLYYRSDGTLQVLSVDATRYRIGAKSTPAASQDLQASVTLTATLY